MKTKKLLVLALPLLLLSACGEEPPSPGPNPTPAYDNKLGDAPTYDEPSISIHYHREDGKYTDYWALWMWEKDGDGAEYKFNGIDSFGAVAAYPLSTWTNALTKGLGVIIKSSGTWNSQTPDITLDLNNYQMDDNKIYNIYFEQGENTIYDGVIYESTNTEGVSVAEFTTEKQVRVVGSKTISKVELFEDDTRIVEKVVEEPSKKVIFDLPEGKIATLEKSYKVKVTFAESGNVKEKGVSSNSLYNTSAFETAYNYDGALGAIYSPTETSFKVWSPVSSSIKIRIYDSGTPKSVDSVKGNDTYAEHDMTRGDKGVWTYTEAGDLAGKYYTYVVTNNAFENREIVDPYAKSAGINGLRGQVVDFSSDAVTPTDWNSFTTPTTDRKETVVYETHVADVTSHTSWGGTKENAKKFNGLVEKGTTYSSGGTTVTTGFDHITELAPTAVQLLPIFDQANDEVNPTFNWGYNPLNYNVVEGVYSSDPYDGYVRVKELRNVVQEFGKKNIGIIMDVVYNHVNGASGSNFDVLMPGYYFRYTADGSFANGSGCGNETASERPMMRKFMIDSVKFWTETYKFQGFRFDLMGLHDLETMNQLVAEVKKVNPNIIIYGEPWTGGTSEMPDFNNKSARQANGNKYVGYGQFNDQMRDALIKGGLNGASAKGWITNMDKVSSADVKAIQEGMIGNTYNPSYQINDPNKTVNYVTCHDNYTLYDRIQVLDEYDNATMKKMATLAEGVVMTSSGTSFMLAGDEMLRTKKLDNNSYNSGYPKNALDYTRKVKNMDVYFDFMDLIYYKKNYSFLHDDKASYTVESRDGGSTLVYKASTDYADFMIIHSNGVGDKSPIDTTGYVLEYDSNRVLAQNEPINSVTPEKLQTIIVRKMK